MPATRLGISPEKIVVDLGLRSESYPWAKVFLRGRRLEVISRRFGIRGTYALTPQQVGRIVAIRPTLN
jgi:hypothetical protein